MAQPLAHANLLWYPTVERTVRLEDLQVPPPKYDTFLAEVVDTFVNFVIETNGVQSLDEVVAKNKAELVKYNPDTVESFFDWLVGPPIVISFIGQLQYSRRSGDGVPNDGYMSVDYTEDLFNPRGGEPIELGSHAEGLAVVVQKIAAELGRRYPDTQGAGPVSFLPLIESESAESAPISSSIRGFNFTLNLKSAPYKTETVVSLINSAAKILLGYEKSLVAVPAIQITVKEGSGPLDGVKTLADRLADLVRKHYKTTATIFMESHSNNMI